MHSLDLFSKVKTLNQAALRNAQLFTVFWARILLPTLLFIINQVDTLVSNEHRHNFVYIVALMAFLFDMNRHWLREKNPFAKRAVTLNRKHLLLLFLDLMPERPIVLLQPLLDLRFALEAQAIEPSLLLNATTIHSLIFFSGLQ